MNTKPHPSAPGSAASINARMSEIGAELAKGRLTPVAGARALQAELDRLRVAYVEALNRESEAARDAAEIAARVEKARQEKLVEEREARIKKAVADATR